MISTYHKVISNRDPIYFWVLLSVTIFFISVFSGCTKEASSESVEEISTNFYNALGRQDYDKALTFYEDTFFDLNPAAAWLSYLKLVNQKLGALKKVKLKHKNVSTIFSGRRFVFIFNNQYEKGLAKETVIFFQHTSKPGIKIQAHKIESTLLSN